MDADSEVEAYASAAAQRYLAKIDASFVDHLAKLVPAHPEEGFSVLDVGCGPGQIPIAIKQRWPGMAVTGIDAAMPMVDQARRNATAAGVDVCFDCLRLQGSEQAQLPYADRSFNFVICNSVLHHLTDPLAAFDEFARVLKSEGGVLVRDLRRPDSITVGSHIAWFGRHYSGEMRRLYEASVRAAYTVPELSEMLLHSRLKDDRNRVFRHRLTHIGIERSVARGKAVRVTSV